MKITSINELLVHIYKINPISGNYCFRGHVDSEWKLKPSIHRDYLKLERYKTVILEAFLLYFLHDKSFKKTHIYTNHPVEFLAMCQHYGIPTRLLDWSNDILVSLYFACEKDFDKDAAIFICNKAPFKKFDFEKFREVTNSPQIIDTHIVNPRLRSQSGSFMIWGVLPINGETTESYTLEEYCESEFETNPIQKLVIPSKCKKEILKELFEKYGINEDSIYLKNSFSEQIEREYDFFKKVSDFITNEITAINAKSPLSPITINLAGCLNLQNLPETPPNGFTQLVLEYVKKNR